MTTPSRRQFLAGALALGASPALAQEPAEPFAKSPSDYPAPPDLANFRLELAEAYAVLGRALVNRYVEPIDDWWSETDPGIRVRFPLDDKKTCWYVLRIRCENAHRGAPVFFRFSLDPDARDNSRDDESGESCLLSYARKYKADIADALGRYLIQILRFQDRTVEGDGDGWVSIIYGKPQLFWLADRDSDVTHLRPDQEIK